MGFLSRIALASFSTAGWAPMGTIIMILVMVDQAI
jgi:hypothetical protein